MADHTNRLIVRGALFCVALALGIIEVTAQPPVEPPPPTPQPSPPSAAPVPQSIPVPVPVEQAPAPKVIYSYPGAGYGLPYSQPTSMPMPAPPLKLPVEVTFKAPKEVTAQHSVTIGVKIRNLSDKTVSANLQVFPSGSGFSFSLAPKETTTVQVPTVPFNSPGEVTISVNSAMVIVEKETKATIKVNPLGIKIAANARPSDLLPHAPNAAPPTARRLAVKLTDVPEISLEQPLAGTPTFEQALDHTVANTAKVKHLNKKNRDGFMETLLAKRRDLDGVPFAMGDVCQMSDGRRFHLAFNSLVLRQTMETFPQTAVGRTSRTPPQLPLPSANFAVQESSAVEDSGLFKKFQDASTAQLMNAPLTANNPEDPIPERITALMQILAPESIENRRELAQYLATIPHVESTKALAKLAIFSDEREVRDAALEGLKTRRERDYTDVLIKGLNYPWPAVAKRTAEAIVKLERNDLIPKLVDVLDQADPRAPYNGKKTAEVRELVRINHHRNCLLCHAPAPETRTGFPADLQRVLPALMVRVPLPGQELPPSSPSGYYDDSIPEILVRADVTYLRQDFSKKLPVENANPWPEMQRFDFVVRTRSVTDDEAKAMSTLFEMREPGVLSEYHRSALFALRELTGRDTAPTAAAWRKLLNL